MSERLLPHDAALERLKGLHVRVIDLSLGRVERLLEALGRPQERLPNVIHVAGTNGKGSTVAFLRAIAEAAGLTVNAFTSPHLVRFAERIRLGGRLIDDATLAELLDRVEAANAGQPITFFEVTAAAALQAFAEHPADVTLVEVGLGGRWDATNVFAAPEASVITPVDLDHAEFLGTDLAGVAAEKAGIIKAGRPVFSARQRPEAERVILDTAAELKAPLTLMGRDSDAWSEGDRLVFEDAAARLKLPLPALAGPHQIANAGLAVATLRALKLAPPDALAAGLATARWPARLQRLTAGPLAAMAEAVGAELLLDGGHNPHAARAVAAALGAMPPRPLALIVGMLASKDAGGFFSEIAGWRPKVFTVAFEGDRVTTPEALAEAALVAGLEAHPCQTVEQAFDLALASRASRVVICGSLYLAGEVLARSPETWPT